MPSCCNNFSHATSRRELLKLAGNSFGYLALAALLAEEARAAGVQPPSQRASQPTNPLAPRPTHLPPRAKRIIFLFMHGGPSQVDTFDPKPKLTADDGKPLPYAPPEGISDPKGKLLRSPWEFAQHGKSGAWVSSLFPEVAKLVDDLCIVRSLHTNGQSHGQAVLKLHTGQDNLVRPSIGSWLVYGLGTENANLPAFVTICPTMGHGGVQNYSNAFLPAVVQGTAIGHAGVPASKASIKYIRSASASPAQQRRQLDLLQEMNREHLGRVGRDPNSEGVRQIEGIIESYELAFRMQTEAPTLLDLADESAATLELYGVGKAPTDNFGRQCLMARRFAERGVRFIQVSHSFKWDQHSNLRKDHEKNAGEVDKPIAGLLRDLKTRGLLKDTLVWWGGEFGRTPTVQGKDGRDHNPHGFTMWLAGGGVKPGLVYGESDDYGWYAVKDKVHMHDLHATILHLLGLDHEKLTYRYAGRDFRLTDVYGNVAKGLLG